ncbi:MAG: deoxynucleoside kinase [Bacteroidales bacterium]
MNYLVIEGNIGAGKTSLASKIGSKFNAKVILEQFSDNPFLPGFYKDPARYTFPLELSFLAERYNQIRNELITPDLFRTFSVSDYYFTKSLIFSKATLSGDEYNLFRQLFDIMNLSVPVPDLYVYLYNDTDKLLFNIKKRGRPYEQSITAEYLDKIQKSYFNFMKQRKDFRFLIINTKDSDFINKEVDLEVIYELIFSKRYMKGINQVEV